MKKTSYKKLGWFKPVRNSYLPNKWEGWVIYLVFIYYLLVSAYSIYHLKLQLMYSISQIAIQWIAGGIIMTWIAKRLS